MKEYKRCLAIIRTYLNDPTYKLNIKKLDKIISKELESQIHTQLNEKRVNKVNLRKEFFYSNVDELEALVHQIDPTAEFTKTMAAEDYRQSISSDTVYSTDYVSDENEDDSDN